MAIVMSMEWDGVTAEQYDAVRKRANWEGDKPAGGILHMAYFTEKGMRVVDVWETAEAFNTFIATRVMPAVQAEGLAGLPKVEIHPVHALFTPGV